MTTVNFPEVLVHAAKLSTLRIEGVGRTLREVMQNICSQNGELQAHLFYENGNFKEHFLLISNGEIVNPDAELPSEAEIDIMLATSGGLDTDELTNDEIKRYVRHITLPGVGREGQLRLKRAKILIIGTGGLGSPVSLYLAAAGVGTIGLVDFDVVESSNLQRQIVHGNSTLGMPKVESAKQRLHDLNPDIQINTYMSALNIDNALELIGAYDIVIDGTDNFTSRYLVNDACAFLKKPLVYGAIYRFDGQISIFNYGDGPCYRCLFPKSPPSELAPNCSAGGVIGVLPGVVGMIQATEAVKLILKIGEPLVGRLMRFDALGMKFSEVRFKRKTSCPTCTPSQTKFAPNLENVTCANVSLAHPSFPAEMYVTPLQLNELILSKTVVA